MSEPDQINDRVTTLEQQMSEVQRDATNALNMARALDRDSADSQDKRRADLTLFHALRETQIEHGKVLTEHGNRLSALDKRLSNFQIETRAGFSMLAAGQAHITEMLTTALERPEEPPSAAP